MKFKKKYAAAGLITAIVLINIVMTIRILFSVAYPERVLREHVTEYFKTNFEKAIKFEDIYINSFGDVILSYFNVSITSDFNDNISLIRSTKTKIRLGFFGLFAGDVRVTGIEFYDSDITLIKKYGRSYRECVLGLIDPKKLISKIKSSREQLQVRFHGSRILYRESLRDRQISLEMYKVGADLIIDAERVSYSARGRIKPHKTEILRRGSFECEGAIDMRAGGIWEHRIEVENFDLTYLNDHIAEYKIAGILLSGGVSVDARFGEKKGVISVAGRVETNSLTVTSTEEKYDLISGENMDIDLGLTVDTIHNRYTVHSLKLNDGIILLDASGMRVVNDKEDAVALKFITNLVDLSELSRNITPFKNIEYRGSLQCEGGFSLDFKKNKASGIRAGMVIGDLTLSKNENGKNVELVGETSVRVKADGTSIDIDIKGKPLNSDITVTGKTNVETWVPFKSETVLSLASRRMNVENISLALVYGANKTFESAYDDKRGGRQKIPFLQGMLGKLLSKNRVDFTSRIDTLFFGKRAGLKNFVLDAQLNNGAATISRFSLEGYDAAYSLIGQGYFNTDQPYLRIAGKADGFDLGRFYADSGMSGSLSGIARVDFSYEASMSRIGDILDNARGSLNIYMGRGEMKNTRFQRDIMAFLAKIGHESPSIDQINFETISLSMTEMGENFWISNCGIRGDTLLFNVAADYLFEGGLDTRFGMVIKSDAGMINLPLRLRGPLLAPCVDASAAKDSPKLCF